MLYSTIFDRTSQIACRVIAESRTHPLFGYAIRSYAHELFLKEGLSEYEKAKRLYSFALSMQPQYKNPEARAAMVEMCRQMKTALSLHEELAGCLDSDENKPRNDFRHGTTRPAYQVKHTEKGPWSGHWTEHRISKCWKDQRGKGKRKRYTQYRCVEMA